MRRSVVFPHGTLNRPVVHNLLMVRNPPDKITEPTPNITWYGPTGRVVPTSDRAWREMIPFEAAAARACALTGGTTAATAATAACFARFAATHR